MLRTTARNILMATTLLMAHAAHAEFVSTHWQAAGDAKATLDTNTGIEWLDLTFTDGKSRNQVVDLLSTTLAGWRFPTASEVHTMMASMFPVLAAYEDTSYAVRTNTHSASTYDTGLKFRNLFGLTHNNYQSAVDWNRSSYGVFEEDDGSLAVSGHNRRVYSTSYNYLYHNFNVANQDPAVTNIYYGHFLVSDGGLTLSSIQDPTLNINNPNAPINQSGEPPVEPPPTPIQVPAPFGLVMFAGLMALYSRARRA